MPPVPKSDVELNFQKSPLIFYVNGKKVSISSSNYLEHEHIWIEFWIIQSKVAISCFNQRSTGWLIKWNYFPSHIVCSSCCEELCDFRLHFQFSLIDHTLSIDVKQKVTHHPSHSYENKNSFIRSLKDDKQHIFEFWNSFAISFMCGSFLYL